MRLGRNARIVILVFSAAALGLLVGVLSTGGNRGADSVGTGVAVPTFPQPDLPPPRLLIPSENERLLSHRFRPSREPQRTWTEDDRRRFWIDPRGVTADYLRSEGKKELETMLEAIP